VLISDEEYERLSKILPPMVIEIKKPHERICIALSWGGVTTKYMPSCELDTAANIIQSFMKL